MADVVEDVIRESILSVKPKDRGKWLVKIGSDIPHKVVVEIIVARRFAIAKPHVGVSAATLVIVDVLE